MAVKGEHISISEQYQNLEQQVLAGRLESLLQLFFKRQIGQPLSSAEQQTIQARRESLLRRKSENLRLIDPAALQQMIDRIHSQLIIRLHKAGSKDQLSPSLVLSELLKYVHEQSAQLLRQFTQLPTISANSLESEQEESSHDRLHQVNPALNSLAAMGALLSSPVGVIQHLDTSAYHVSDVQAAESFSQQQLLDMLEYSILMNFDIEKIRKQP